MFILSTKGVIMGFARRAAKFSIFIFSAILSETFLIQGQIHQDISIEIPKFGPAVILKKIHKFAN